MRCIIISIIVVNWNSYDFLELLIESLEIYSILPYELIIIDNSIKKQRINRDNITQRMMLSNVGHGQGLNEGVKLVNHPFVMFLDVDTHILCHKWENLLLEMMGKFDVIGGRGVTSKPIRPACMFMKKEFAQQYDWSPTEGYKGERGNIPGFDVAIRAYYQMLRDNVKIGFLESRPNRYGTIVGEEFCAGNQPIVYHHWHGSHLKERQVDFPNDDLQKNKELLFSKIPWRIVNNML